MGSVDPFGVIGTTIAEKYLVEAVADAGGTAVVYRAFHVLWQRHVALKMFRAPLEISPEDRTALFERFVQEGRLLAELSERSIAVLQARDIGTFTTPEGEWVPYTVLEWLEGETLERLLERESLANGPTRSLAEAVDLLEPIAEALGLAHRRGIVHRDVKPSNLFAVREGMDVTLKLLDFGIAKVMADARDASSLRRTGGLSDLRELVSCESHDLSAFTPAYGAPEQFVREIGPTGPWTDVFALALVLLELVSRRPPLEGETVEELGRSSMRISLRPSLSRIGKAGSADVEAVFSRAVSVEPARRFRSVEDFWTSLRAAIAASSRRPLAATLPAPDAPDAPGAPPRANVRRYAAFSVLGLVIFVAISGALKLVGIPQARPLTTRSVTQRPPEVPTTTPPPAPPACPAGMVMIAASAFFMGSDESDSTDDERPAHKVRLETFCIDRTEVTAEAFATCVERGACTGKWSTNDWPDIAKAERALYDPLCNATELSRRGRHPANCVSWQHARDYCTGSGARLPSEAEWELAARGPDGRRYPWGDAEPTALRLNACGAECAVWGQKRGVVLPKLYGEDDGWPATAPVGSFPQGASPYGLLDMTGNVWEWVDDRHGPYDAAEVRAPVGPEVGDHRVLRGGAWNGAEGAWVRPTFRFHASPTMRSHGIGFRCAMSIAAATPATGIR